MQQRTIRTGLSQRRTPKCTADWAQTSKVSEWVTIDDKFDGGGPENKVETAKLLYGASTTEERTSQVAVKNRRHPGVPSA